MSTVTFCLLALLSILSLGQCAEAIDEALTVDTPDLYEKFKKGIIGTDYESVYVEPTSHPDLLSEVKHFSHFKNFEIRFKDARHNLMYLFPRHDRVKAFFWNGNHLAQHIPIVHKVYEVVYAYRSYMSEDELGVIFHLTNAEKLTLSNSTYFSLDGDLEHRIAAMKNLGNLHKFVLEVAAPADMKVQLRPFLEIPPVLTEALFTLPATMTAKQRVQFAKNQQVPDGWELSMDADAHWLSFKKVLFVV